MYIFAVALEDRTWHHDLSYSPERAHRPSTVARWHKITTREDGAWTERYNAPPPEDRAFGGRIVVKLDDGSTVEDEIAVADAHPRGARPFRRPDYVAKFRSLADGVVPDYEQDRFLGLAQS